MFVILFDNCFLRKVLNFTRLIHVSLLYAGTYIVRCMQI